jgi:TolB-like protein
MKRVLTLISASIIMLGMQAQKTATKTQPVSKQEKYDIVLKMDGDELEGTVKEILDLEIKFAHKGESLVYAIKKSEILKINFASGRIEFINRPASPSAKKNEKPADANSGNDLPQNENNRIGEHHNKVAILPFHYTINKQRAAEEVSDEVQEECFSILSKHSEGLTLLAPHITNAILSKAGVNFNTIANYTMDELCNMLGVEYLVEGRVSQIQTGSVSSQSNSYNDRYSNRNNNYNTSGSSTSTNSQTYRTTLSLNIFTDKNATIYNDEKISLWSTETYKSTLVYLLKRCPLYKK